MPELISQRQYAKRRGVSPEAVRKAVMSGRITLIPDERGRKKVNPQIADIQWAQNTDIDQQMRGTRGAPAIPAGVIRHPTTSPAEPVTGGIGDRARSFEARDRIETAEAALAEIKLAEKMGQLVDAAAIEREMAAKIQIVGDALDSIPHRLAPILAAESDPLKVAEILASELLAARRGLVTPTPGLDS